jgi:hypothetical protein
VSAKVLARPARAIRGKKLLYRGLRRQIERLDDRILDVGP